jgi:hypothetical protein
LRTPLIEGYDWAKFTLFGDSTSAEVLRGSNGWLFLGQPNARAYIEGTKRPSDIDLDYFVQVFAARAEFCRAHGARYLLAFPPDKSSVYPEFLPANVTLARPTPLERLIPRLRAAHIEVVDLMPALLEAKRDGEVYSRGDTHWNGRGAYAAYRVIAAALRSSGVKPIDPTSVREQLGVREGDLLGMSGVGRLFADRQVDVTFVQRSRRIETPQYADTEPAGHGTEPFATVRDDPSLPTAVMFSDSFAFRLWPFLDESFRRLLHVRTSTQPFNEHLIVAERPVVVIQELVERTLTEPQEQ